MSVNIWVTPAEESARRVALQWGAGLYACAIGSSKTAIYSNSPTPLYVQESPREINAQVRVGQRKRRRGEIAAQVIAALGSGRQISDDTLANAAAYSILVADALLAALDAREEGE